MSKSACKQAFKTRLDWYNIVTSAVSLNFVLAEKTSKFIKFLEHILTGFCGEKKGHLLKNVLIFALNFLCLKLNFV